MAYQTLENISDMDLQQVLSFPNLDTPIFWPIILFVLFMVFTSLTFFRESAREGKANLLSSLAVGGFVTTAIAGILSLLQLISYQMVITTMVISIVFQGLYLFTSSGR